MSQYREETIAADGTVTTVVYDTDTGTCTTYVNGVQTSQRPLTPDEVTSLNNRDASVAAQENAEQLQTEIEENIDVLLATVDALNAITDIPNSTINQNPAAIIKDVAREVKTVARQTVRIARVITGTTDTTDSGS